MTCSMKKYLSIILGTLLMGSCMDMELLPNDKNLYVYLRSYEDKKMLVICSFTRDAVRFDAPESLKISKAALVLNNYEHNFVISEGFTTRPYEMRVYLFA